MSSVQKKSKVTWRRTRRGRPRRITSTVQSSRARCCRAGRSRKFFKYGKSKRSTFGSSKVSEKLEALKNLIPSHQNGEVVKAEQLFRETASYIARLRTQVLVLQKLIEYYGSSRTKKEEEEGAATS